MALMAPQLEALKEVLDRKNSDIRMLSLGYPDLLVDVATIERLFGKDIAGQLTFRDDSAEILGWHGATGRLPKVIDSAHFFPLIGVSCEYVDIVQSRGIERVVDLNDPLPDDLVEAFDFVLDPGTIEHCCNIGQALKNIASSLKKDGYVCHLSPLSMFNHGFYNINPTLFVDFYTQNDFEMVFLAATVGDKFAPQMADVPGVERFLEAPPNTSILAVATRLKVGPINWPMQSKYMKNPDLKATDKG